MSKKLIYAVVAIGTLFTSAAYAGNDDGSPITRGTSGVVIPTPSGVPYIMPFVSDRTAKRSRTPDRIYRETR